MVLPFNKSSPGSSARSPSVKSTSQLMRGLLAQPADVVLMLTSRPVSSRSWYKFCLCVVIHKVVLSASKVCVCVTLSQQVGISGKRRCCLVSVCVSLSEVLSGSIRVKTTHTHAHLCSWQQHTPGHRENLRIGFQAELLAFDRCFPGTACQVTSDEIMHKF